jgi:uncharacterized membrane protein YgcG
MTSRVQITLDNSTLELAPGDTAVVAVTLTNVSAVVDSFVVTVEGLDPEWYSIQGERVGVFPGQSTSVVLRVMPPHDSAALAGNYPFTITATSVDDPTQRSTADLTLHLSAAGGVALELKPQRASGRKHVFGVVISNTANQPVTLVVSATDPEEALRYAFGTPTIRTREWAEKSEKDLASEPQATQAVQPSQPQAAQPTQATGAGAGAEQVEQATEDEEEPVLGAKVAEGAGSLEYELEVPAGGRATVPLLVAPTKRVWTGKERPFPFEVRIHPPGVEWDLADARAVQGELAYRPMLALWAGLPVALRRAIPIVLGLLLLGLLLYLLLNRPGQPSLPTAQAQAQATQTAIAVATVSMSATLTALAQAAGGNGGSGGSGGNSGGHAGGGGSGSGSGSGASGAGGAEGVPVVNRFWLVIPPTVQPSGTFGEESARPDLQWDIDAADNVVITPTRRTTLLPGWETSSIVDYALTALGERGSTTNTLSLLLVRPPSIGLLTAVPLTITVGSTSDLKWSVLGAKDATLDGGPADLGPVGDDGQSRTGGVTVRPPQTHIYIFCASNAAGETCKSVKVTVVGSGAAVPPAGPLSPTPVPTSTAAGPTPTLRSAPSSQTPPPPSPHINTFTPTHTAMPTNVPTAIPTNTGTRIVTATPNATRTATNSPTATSLATSTGTPTLTVTPTKLPHVVPTNTPTHTPTNTRTNTPTHTPTNTRTNTPTNTHTNTPTHTPTNTPTNTPTPFCTDWSWNPSAQLGCTISVHYSVYAGCPPVTVTLVITTSCHPRTIVQRTYTNGNLTDTISLPGCYGPYSVSGTLTARNAGGATLSWHLPTSGVCIIRPPLPTVTLQTANYTTKQTELTTDGACILQPPPSELDDECLLND